MSSNYDALVIGSANLQYYLPSSLGDLISEDKVRVKSIDVSDQLVTIHLDRDGQTALSVKDDPQAFPGGGAVNIASVLATLGLKVYLVIAAASDSNGRRIRKHLDDLGVTYQILDRSATAVTLTLKGKNHSCSMRCKPDFQAQLPVTFPARARAVIGAGVSFSELSVLEAAFRAFPEAVHSFSPSTDLHTSFRGDVRLRQLLSQVDFLQLNEAEVVKVSQLDSNLGRKEILNWGVRNLIVTKDCRGSMICGQGGDFEFPPCHPTTIVDQVGCGDAHLAGFIHHWLHLQDINKAMRFANIVASIMLGIQGTSSFPLPTEWSHLLSKDLQTWKSET